MNVIPNFTPVIAALCKLYGKRVSGGYEIFIPARILGELSPAGQIQQQPDDPTKPGLRLRYLPNRTVNGHDLHVVPDSPETPQETSLIPAEGLR